MSSSPEAGNLSPTRGCGWVRWIVKRVSPQERTQEILGDLEILHLQRTKEVGQMLARWRYRREVAGIVWWRVKATIGAWREAALNPIADGFRRLVEIDCSPIGASESSLLRRLAWVRQPAMSVSVLVFSLILVDAIGVDRSYWAFHKEQSPIFAQRRTSEATVITSFAQATTCRLRGSTHRLGRCANATTSGHHRHAQAFSRCDLHCASHDRRNCDERS